MDDVTKIETAPLDCSSINGVIPFDEGAFAYNSQQAPRVSSGDKRVYRGAYHSKSEAIRESVAAVAKFYSAAALEKFGREAAALARGSVIGVGPRLLQISVTMPPSGTETLPVIVEEYAGAKLSDVIEGAIIPGESQDRIVDQELLREPSEDRQKQTAKIVHDLMLHVHRMHTNGICHGDLKASNVCVRAIGPNPWDVRATFIDFDLEASVSSATPRERTAAYYDKLFKDVPRALGLIGEARPSMFELDMACLSAVCLEVARGKRIDEMKAIEIAEAFEAEPGVFRYSKTDVFQAWRINPAQHIAPYAKKAGMLSVQQYYSGCSEPFMRRARVLADAELKGGLFLDAENIRRIEANPEMELIRREDDAAHAVFRSYCESLRASGEAPDYQTFEEQPSELQQSCYGQAADLCEKMVRLGYALVRTDKLDGRAPINALDEEQVEAMARWEHERWLDERRSMGWTFGQERSAEKKTSPYLVAYDDLDEQAKETRNRAPMRDALIILADADLAVVPL